MKPREYVQQPWVQDLVERTTARCKCPVFPKHPGRTHCLICLLPYPEGDDLIKTMRATEGRVPTRIVDRHALSLVEILERYMITHGPRTPEERQLACEASHTVRIVKEYYGISE